MTTVMLAITALAVALVAFGRAYRDHGLVEREMVELQQKLAKAERRLKQRGDLANEIAHEIKNPITAILCSADTLDLLIGKDLDKNHRQTLRYIREYGDNLLRLVSDFIDLSRAESGQIRARPEGIQLLPVAESIMGLLKANADMKSIDLNIQQVDERLYAYVDPKHFKQILFNLVHNAIKFTEPGGEVRIDLQSGFPNKTVSISVQDNGVGIPEHQIPRLFNLYARFENETESEIDTGVGLGLALCKELAELAGGEISVKSKSGVGSVFTVSLPRFQTRSLEPYETKIVEELVNHPLAGQRYLVFDSDEGSRHAIADLIEAWGGAVEQVGEAIDAIEALKINEYDAVMVDPSICQDTVEIVRNANANSKTPIIVSCKSKKEEALIIEAGADQALPKPLNGKLLLTSLLNTGKDELPH